MFREVKLMVGRSVQKALALAVTAGVVALSGAAASAQEKTPSVTAIKVGVLHVGDGKTIEKAIVVVEGGKITAVVAGLPIPDGATVVVVA
ncbi:MAG: hypothetical protein AB7G11_14200 [Phycisphaerales bacterium]